VDLALRTIDVLDTELDQLDATLAHVARGQPGCQALMGRYGIGWLTAVSSWAEFGDVRRFANSRQAVRFTGLDITVAASDTKRARGHLARQGPPVLRWALHEAAMCAARPGSPDHAYYLQVRTRLGASGPPSWSPASSPVRPTTSWASSATRRWSRSCSNRPPDPPTTRRAMAPSIS
jgi:transposase